MYLHQAIATRLWKKLPTSPLPRWSPAAKTLTSLIKKRALSIRFKDAFLNMHTHMHTQAEWIQLSQLCAKPRVQSMTPEAACRKGRHSMNKVPYSSKFSWHYIFVNFVIRHPKKKFFSQKFRTASSGRGFTRHNHKIFITKISICVLFNILTKFLDHENSELYGKRKLRA